MGLRFKLLLPVVVGLGAMVALLHFYWTPAQLAHSRHEIIASQQHILDALEPGLARHLLTNDLATLHSTLDQQLQVNADLWHGLILSDLEQRRLYPLAAPVLPAAPQLQLLSHRLQLADTELGHIQLWVDPGPLLAAEQRRLRLLELIAALTIGLLVGASFVAQDWLIRRPLLALRSAAVRLQQGDYEARLPRAGSDEIGQLTRTFAGMRTSLMQERDERWLRAEKLGRQLHYESALAACSRTLMEDADGALAQALRLLLAPLGVSDIRLFENRFQDDLLVSTTQTLAVGTAATANPTQLTLPLSTTLARWRRLLQNNEPVAGNIEDLPQGERECLEPGSLRAMVALPIWVDGIWRGIIRFDDTRSAQAWNDQDMLPLRTCAEMVAAYLQRKRAESLGRQAYHDPLTELPNRRFLIDYLDRTQARLEREGDYGATLFLDLDRFKTINDSLGHGVGDALLQEVAQRLSRLLRKEDLAARLGGDEFVVLLSELGPRVELAAEHAHSVASKMRDLLSQPYQLGEHHLHITPSIGIAMFPSESASAEQLVQRADTAMYRAKAMGRNTICFFHPRMQEAADTRLALEKDLRRGLAEGEFSLYYQPQVALGSGQVRGTEGLLRWQHPERGLVLPGEFIPVAEDSGLILPLGHWVLEAGFRQMRDWLEQGLISEHFHFLSLNVSPRQFQQADFVQQVTELLNSTGAPPERLEFELTEGTLIADVDDAVAKIEALRELGIRVAIDDFGTGYSSLAYLKRLPLDKLKIDRSFIGDIPHDLNDVAIVDATLAMASHLGLEVVAEGVENSTQVDFLAARGCGLCQGFHLGHPLPAEAFERWLLGPEARRHLAP